MGKMPTKKGQERRKHPRKARKRTLSSSKPLMVSEEEFKEVCLFCGKGLGVNSRAIFVEEEVGRIFCTEECITGYFTNDVEKLEKEYFRQLSKQDLTVQERHELSHLRWLTLQEPDEIWREKTQTGDFRYTLISEFHPSNKTVWYICICLFLRGEPSFLYLAFPSKDQALVHFYRRGERVEKVESSVNEKSSSVLGASKNLDRLAEDWTEGESLRAQRIGETLRNDIPMEDYGLYQSCLDETLEEPDEVWVVQKEKGSGLKTYHFIRHYSRAAHPFWFVIVARETENEDEIEIIDAFPTQNVELAECYRRGKQEVGVFDSTAPSRLVH